MKYNSVPYDQLHGTFTPFVSSLDLVANCGPEGQKVFSSNTINWRKKINVS